MIFQAEFDPENFGNKFLNVKEKLTNENSRMETVCFCENFDGGKKEIQLASEIAESKQPYKEIEALINKSRLVLRTQKLAPVKDRDKEKEKEKDTNTKNKILGNFTDKPVRLLLTEVKNDGNKVARSKTKSPKIDESIKNTNAYLLRIKKTESRNENIDLQLKIPSVGYVGQTINSSITHGKYEHPITIVRRWYDNEIKHFDKKLIANFNPDPETFNKISNVTQMLWSGTKEVGCARAVEEVGDKLYKTTLVCNWKPAGNIFGKYVYEIKASQWNEDERKRYHELHLSQ